jgi:hypothetical protein
MNYSKNSREAPKFVIRFPPALHAAMTERAAHKDRSLNAEINQALTAYLNPRARVRRSLSLLYAVVDSATLKKAEASLPVVSMDRETNKVDARMNVTIRYNDGMQAAIRAKAQNDGTTIIEIKLNAFLWWLHSHELEEKILDLVSSRSAANKNLTAIA